MEFKIDTKPTYSILTPLSVVLDAGLTESIRQKWEELTQSGSGNIIIDLSNCLSADENAGSLLAGLHEEVYSNGQSLVFVNISGPVTENFRNNEVTDLLNIAPTLIEAIDLVSMEILERDLFNEES